MRYIALILITSILWSCNRDTKIDNGTTQTSRNDSTSAKLPGEWSLYATVINEHSILCNVCPQLTLSKDLKGDSKNLTGTIVYPTGQTENLTWTPGNETINILNIGESTNSKTIDNGDYIITYTEATEYPELKLTQPQKKYSYLFRKK